MVSKLAVVAMCISMLPGALAQNRLPEKSSLVERIGDTGFVRVDAESFKSLDAKQQELAYWLAQASIAIDPILYDQFSQFGLRQKRLLEEIVAHPAGIRPDVLTKITDFTKLFWANHGNHNETTSQKFLPRFTFDELKKAGLTAQAHGAMKTGSGDLSPILTAAELEKEVSDLQSSLFDPNFEPMITAKSPEGGKDIIQASSNTFYKGVSLADLKDFHDQQPLNSRVVRDKQGNIRELVYRTGAPDGKIPPGVYATYLKRANEYLSRAAQVAEPAQAQAIRDLIRYYQTGDPEEWLQFGSDWVQNDAAVDFANGFIEIYRDARGAKGSSQSFVSVTDASITSTMVKLAQNAEYFEQRAPWDDKYKKQAFKPPVIKAVETVIETGDFGVTTIGDNLPNENQIRERYGSKNFLFTSSTRALNNVAGHKVAEEFGANPEVVRRNEKYGDEAQDILVALHEVIGHGSGKLSDRLKGGSAPELKEYFSTLEEGRADLMALWNVWDPKLKALGLITDQEEVAKAMYDASALVALTQLRRIPKGDTIEEDHQRNRQLIVNYIRDKVPGSIEQFDRDGKTFVQVQDYQKMRQGVGMLLSELMRIKAEGDYGAIKALVDQYAVHFQPALRDQIMKRYQTLDLPTYFAGINAKLTAQLGKDGAVQSVNISYPAGAEQQYLDYAAMYDKGLAASAHIK